MVAVKTLGAMLAIIAASIRGEAIVVNPSTPPNSAETETEILKGVKQTPVKRKNTKRNVRNNRTFRRALILESEPKDESNSFADSGEEEKH